MSKNNNLIKVIFIGTPDFAVPSLQSLINDVDFDILAVVTQPDKKIGRKQTTSLSPVKLLAKKNNITVLQPDKISGISSEITKL